MKWLILIMSLVLLSSAAPEDKLDQLYRLRVTPEQITCTVTSDGSASDTDTKADNAADGDVVCLPSGTYTWETQVTITKAITLRGAGCTLDANGRPPHGSSTSCSTVIKDGVVARTNVLSWTLVANKNSRMSYIEFQDASAGPANSNGVIEVYGANTDARRMRVDHCKFNDLHGTMVFSHDLLGVYDHNTWYRDSDYGGILTYVYHFNWDGYTESDGSRADTVDVNAEDWLYFENNNFEYSDFTYAVTDAYRGARYVLRYNTIYNGWVEAHGTDSGGRPGGTRSVLAYNNEFICQNGATCTYVGNMRSGAGGLYMDNTVTGYTSPIIQLAAYRAFWPFAPWGQANGANAWDVNSGAAAITGTATGGGTASMVDSGASFADLTGYVVTKTNCVAFLCAGFITSNTGTTLTLYNDSSYHAQVRYEVAASPAPTTTTARLTGSYGKFTVGSELRLGCDANCTCSGATRRITANDINGDVTWSPSTTAPTAGQSACLAVITFQSGDTYSIRKPLEFFDQPGRSRGTRLLARSMSGCTELGTTVTCVTNAAHGYSTGDYVVIAWIDPPEYQGTYQITVTGGTTFTYTSPYTGLSSGAAYGNVSLQPTANDEVDEPWYECRNTQGATNIGFVTGIYAQQIRSGEHYFSDTCYPGFTGYTYPHPLVVTP